MSERTETTPDEEGARNAPAWVQSVTPAEIVRQRSLQWPDFHPEDFCWRCGQRNPCWFADTEVWQTATGSTGDGGGVYCPTCFVELWETKTGKTAILWRLSIDPRSRDAVRTETTPDEEVRQHPLHAVLADALRTLAPEIPTVRIWGRKATTGIDSVLGYQGNAWAGSPEDVADHLVRAVLDNLPTIDGRWAITPTLEAINLPAPNLTIDPDEATRRRAAAVLERVAARLRAGEDL